MLYRIDALKVRGIYIRIWYIDSTLLFQYGNQINHIKTVQYS